MVRSYSFSIRKRLGYRNPDTSKLVEAVSHVPLGRGQ